MLDVCHMLRLVRNTLDEGGMVMDIDGGKIYWQYIATGERGAKAWKQAQSCTHTMTHLLLSPILPLKLLDLVLPIPLSIVLMCSS